MELFKLNHHNFMNWVLILSLTVGAFFATYDFRHALYFVGSFQVFLWCLTMAWLWQRNVTYAGVVQ